MLIPNLINKFIKFFTRPPRTCSEDLEILTTCARITEEDFIIVNLLVRFGVKFLLLLALGSISLNATDEDPLKTQPSTSKQTPVQNPEDTRKIRDPLHCIKMLPKPGTELKAARPPLKKKNPNT